MLNNFKYLCALIFMCKNGFILIKKEEQYIALQMSDQ